MSSLVEFSVPTLIRPLLGIVGVACLLQVACNGFIGTGEAGGSSENPSGQPDGPSANPTDANGALKCTAPAVGPSPLRRLTSAEYNNAVADLLGDTTRPGATFPADNRVGLFDNTAAVQTVPLLLAEKYVESAAALAEGIKDVGALVGCDVAAADATACVTRFIERFGRRAYRRPLLPAEVSSLLQIWNGTTGEADAVTGVRGVVAAVLVSPHFLFRPEFGSGPSSIPGTQKLSTNSARASKWQRRPGACSRTRKPALPIARFTSSGWDSSSCRRPRRTQPSTQSSTTP